MPPVHEARRIRLRGHDQGVGFRPFVYRLATEHGLSGYVQNQLGEVEVVAAGPAESVDNFIDGLVDEAPPLSSPSLAEVTDAQLPATTEFRIIDSLADADAQIFVPPDYLSLIHISEPTRLVHSSRMPSSA